MVYNSKQPKILNLCLDIMKPFLAVKSRFIDGDESINEINYVLKDELQQYSREDINGRALPVIQMKNGFWLGCNFSFYKRKQNKKDLKQICFLFFDEEVFLFRLDWACSDIEESKKHAQPHWHFDRNSVVKKGISNTSYIPYAKYQDVTTIQNEPITVDLGRVHFFMNWIIEKDKDVQTPYLDFRDEKILKNWLTNTLLYIDTELKALASK